MLADQVGTGGVLVHAEIMFEILPHRRPVEQSEHQPEHGHALLCVQAAVDRIDEDQRILGAEVAEAGLFRQDRELLSTLDDRRELGEDHDLGEPVDLERRIASRAYAVCRTADLRAGNGKHRLAHSGADARKDLQPGAGFQMGA